LKIRYYVDPATGLPHIYNHQVEEDEVEEVLAEPGEDRAGSRGSRVALGQTAAGRYLRFIYVADAELDSVVITAFDLAGRALAAYRRRRRKKYQ
jgi:hypothetical protein